MNRKADLNRLRRNVAPARDAIAALGSIAGDLVTESTGPYLRDCQDHVQQIHDLVESYRDTVASLIDIHLNVASQRMNEIMKVLTIIATIFMPLGLIGGIYGMNFDPEASPYNMPELRWFWGYPAALAVMFLIASGFMLFFWRRGWLGRRG